MKEAVARVLDLLTYIEQAEKIKTKPSFSIASEYFVAHRHELHGLPEVQLNLQAEGNDVWLRVPRLQEVAAPSLDPPLLPWVTLSKSPEKAPEIKSQVSSADERPVLLADHPEVRDLFKWYVEMLWKPWAAAERPRRKTIAQYNHLFSLQQAIASDGAETPLEVVWGLGYAAWKKPGHATPVKHPLIVQPCEVVVNEKTFDLEVRPRDVPPRLEVDCYAEMEVAGVRQLDAFWKSFLESGAQRVNPFDDTSFDGVLKAAVGHLDPTGAYEVTPGVSSLPLPGEQLKIANSWVVYGRKRSGDIFLEDVRRLKASVESAPALPGVIRSLVEHGDSEVRVAPEQPFRGLSSSEAPAGAFELYFPMPYNEEQVAIIQKLERNDGVVVQGPPGTGKTHTIANVICHYLAQGKRVLVTAKGETALSVLQEKLPERIRPLSVSLLSDERDGMKQFEHSIQTIAASVASLNPTRAAAVIDAAAAKLNQTHAKISQVDQAIEAFASKHMRTYRFLGRDMSPEELAKFVIGEAEIHEWFDDEPPANTDGAVPFNDAFISELRTARILVGAELRQVGLNLPHEADIPALSELLGLHRDLVKARTIESNVEAGDFLALVDSTLETFEKAQLLGAFLSERAAVQLKLAGGGASAVGLAQRFADLRASSSLLKELFDVCGDIRKLEDLRLKFIPRAVEIPQAAEKNEDYCDALTRLLDGKSAFGLSPFGKGEARKMLAATRVLGEVPAATEEWSHVRDILTWRNDARKTLARWNALAVEFGIAAEPATNLESGVRAALAVQSNIESARQLVFDYNAIVHVRLCEVFGQLTADRMFQEEEAFLELAARSISAHVDKGRLAHALKRVQDLLQRLRARNGDIANSWRAFLSERVGNVATQPDELKSEWEALFAEVLRLEKLRPALDIVHTGITAIKDAGAVRWSARLRENAASADFDPYMPATWLDAWKWRQAAMFLDRIDGHAKLRELFLERKNLTNLLGKTYQELVAEKTWLGVFNNSPEAVRQALQAYLNAVQAMGSGTGVRAIRHRRAAREAMLRAYKAVPCWVLPQWRVSETIPPEVGLFDLVVVDEASQSDIWALPALLRGKKLLVVGDHKQVSPSAIGTAEERIKELQNRFLANQPHASEMTPDKSIYDLARVVFAGNSVMLKEHFRCVPAIIEFSNREFYKGDIVPLRLPKANERLDPPLVDVYVKGGFRKGDENLGEATAIVSEIVQIIADPAMQGKTIGVVTLLGTSQAALIHKMVSDRISALDMVRHKIAVGPPPVFQGRERDIMLVSMVLAPGDRAAQNKAETEQRFNVALSRARDRMYLFRSVTESTFKEDTLNTRLIRHFSKPFVNNRGEVGHLRELCESGFEREMFDELTKRGYRVRPQVECGRHRIDFVVEGAEGRRLAVECDGDRFHGPGQWSADMTRQRVLERAGWTFWRCFASSFVRRREEVLEDLFQTLGRLGIEPLGSDEVDSSVWVGFKEVDPFGVEEEEVEQA